MASAVLLPDAEAFSDVPVIGYGKRSDAVVFISRFVHFLILYPSISMKRKDNLPSEANLPFLSPYSLGLRWKQNINNFLLERIRLWKRK